MRLVLVILLLSLATLAASYETGKVRPKSSTKDKAKQELPPLADDDEKEYTKNGMDPNEEDEKPSKQKSVKKPSKTKAQVYEEELGLDRLQEMYQNLKDRTGRYPESGKEVQEHQGDSNDDSDDEEFACPNNHDVVCECHEDEVVCDKIMYVNEKDETQETPLSTANLNLGKFKPKTVRVTNNYITVLKKDKILPEHQSSVEELDFSKNYIFRIEDKAFDDFTNLKKLKLSNNKLKTIKKSMFEGMDSLHQLNLESNPIKSIEKGAFSGAKNLKKLILDNNPSMGLTEETFEGLDSLEELSLDGCALNMSIPINLFSNLPNLKKLSLRNNPFTEIPKAINALDKLEHLDISRTDIPELHSQSFKSDHKLQSLRADDMEYLYSVMDCAFCGMENLRAIYMNNNSHLYHFHENAFGYADGSKGAVVNLEVLQLDYCNISVLHENMLYWDRVKELSIGENPIDCNCETAFLLGSETFKFEHSNLVPKCASPPELAKKPLADVRPSAACANLKNLDQMSRAAGYFLFLLLLVLVSIGGFLLYQKGMIQSCIVSAKQAASIPQMSYSNLASEDNASLQNDFQPTAV